MKWQQKQPIEVELDIDDTRNEFERVRQPGFMVNSWRILNEGHENTKY